MNKEILNIVNRVLSEELTGKINENKRRLFESDKMCSECGNTMKEGECMECGYMEESELEEKLHGKQHKIDKNKNGRIDSEDFKLLRNKKTEVKEKLYGRQRVIDKNKNNKIDAEDFKLLRKESVYSIELDGKRMLFNEGEVINIIENIILEEKKKDKKTTKLPNVTKDSLAKSKKENDDYVSDVVKKMKDYLKDASKGSFEMEPKHFPKGNGELAKMSKHAYIPSETTEEYIENFTAASLDNIEYDDIHPNEKWVEMNYVGNSLTGNNPEWANAVETPVNKKRNELRKNNYLRRVQKMSYQKDDQPVTTDRTGQDGGEDEHRIFGMLKKATKKSKKSTNESVGEQKVISDLNNMKKLMGYNSKTQ
jgi:hypothetical protein